MLIISSQDAKKIIRFNVGVYNWAAICVNDLTLKSVAIISKKSQGFKWGGRLIKIISLTFMGVGWGPEVLIDAR